MWIDSPTTGRDDATLTIALAGFVFAVFFTTAALVAAWVTNNPDFLSSVALIDTAILTPSLASYVGRKWTDKKYKDTDEEITPDVENELKNNN